MKTKEEAGKRVRSGMALLIATTMTAGLLTGCGSTNAETPQAQTTEKETTAETTAEETAEESTETTVKEEDTALSTENDSDFATVVSEDEAEAEPDPIEVTVKELTFEVPGYYTFDDVSDDGTSVRYDYAVDDSNGAFLIMGTEENVGISSDQFRQEKDQILEDVKNSLESAGNPLELTDTKQTEYMGMPGYALDYDGTYEDIPATVDLDLYLDSSADRMYMFAFVVLGDPARDVKSDYIQMMKNASWTEDTASGDENTTKKTKEEAKKTASADAGVSPDVKKVLDSYESMMNEYCDFMVKYKNADSSDALAMLDDYYDILDEYTKAMDELNGLDTSSMSTADYEYYLDVTNRVSKRLLEVSGS